MHCSGSRCTCSFELKNSGTPSNQVPSLVSVLESFETVSSTSFYACLFTWSALKVCSLCQMSAIRARPHVWSFSIWEWRSFVYKKCLCTLEGLFDVLVYRWIDLYRSSISARIRHLSWKFQQFLKRFSAMLHCCHVPIDVLTMFSCLKIYIDVVFWLVKRGMFFLTHSQRTWNLCSREGTAYMVSWGSSPQSIVFVGSACIQSNTF